MCIDLIQSEPQRVIDELTEANKRVAEVSKKRKTGEGGGKRAAEEESEHEFPEVSTVKREEIVMRYIC